MSDDAAECRACRRKLEGNPYWKGGDAYVPAEAGRPRRRALPHYFGGWICSARCEIRVFNEMRASGVWGSTEARLMAGAHDRHEANR